MDLTWAESADLVVHIAMGVGLAACAGLRAFLPLFVVGAAGKLGLTTLSASYAWLGDWPALIVFGTALVAELLGDKFPIVDHVLDSFQTIVKPVAGALLMATVVSDWAPLYVAVFWIVAGGTIAGGVHVAKAKLRLVSSATTAGFGNPLISVGEDVGVVAGSVVSLAAPVLVVLIVVSGGVLGWLVLRRRRQGAITP